MKTLKYTKAVKTLAWSKYTNEQAKEVSYDKAQKLIDKYLSVGVTSHVSFAGWDNCSFVVYVTHN